MDDHQVDVMDIDDDFWDGLLEQHHALTTANTSTITAISVPAGTAAHGSGGGIATTAGTTGQADGLAPAAAAVLAQGERDPIVPRDRLFVQDESSQNGESQGNVVHDARRQSQGHAMDIVSEKPQTTAPNHSTSTDLDLNDPVTLSLYDQVLLWRHNAPDQAALHFQPCTPAKEAVLHRLAMKFGLSYCFDASSGRATVQRPEPVTVSSSVVGPSQSLQSYPVDTSAPASSEMTWQPDDYPFTPHSAHTPISLPLSDYPALSRPSIDSSDPLYSASSHSQSQSSLSLSLSNLSSTPQSPSVAATPFPFPSDALALSRSHSHSQPLKRDSLSQRVSTWKIFGSSPLGIHRGRKGPLGACSRDAMRALEAVGGACWRCKVIRRKCDPGSPCKSCPAPDLREDVPLWLVIGCRRGSLSDAMPRQSLCPKSRRPTSRSSLSCSDHHSSHSSHSNHSGSSSSSSATTTGTSPADHHSWAKLGESYLLASKGVMDKDALQVMQDFEASRFVRTGNREAAVVFAEIVRGGKFVESVSLNKSCRIRDKALTYADLITEIAWELADGRDLMGLLEIESAARFVKLLQTACTYEEEVTKRSTSLVLFSVVCLKYALDSLRLLNANLLPPAAHNTCSSDCSVTSIRVLQSYLAAYVDSLSLVMFKKENLRDRRWWLSTFYSLLIQSHVRHILCVLEKEIIFPGCDDPPNESLYSTQYLHLAAICFTAVSAQYDPLLGGRLQYKLTDDSVVPETEVPEGRNLEARTVCGVEGWEGGEGSYGFLRRRLQIGSLDFASDGSDTRMLVDMARQVLPTVREGSVATSVVGAGAYTTGGSHSHGTGHAIVARRPRKGVGHGRTTSVASTESASGSSLNSFWTECTEATSLTSLSSPAQASLSEFGLSVGPGDGSAKAPLLPLPLPKQGAVGAFSCSCCSKKPQKFETEEELRNHQLERPHICPSCPSRFKTAPEADRHINALHRRPSSWSCSRLSSPLSAFHSITTDKDKEKDKVKPAAERRSGGDDGDDDGANVQTYDICGFCGRGFRRVGAGAGAAGRDEGELVGHVRDEHAFGACSADKKFYRADNFRQHLKTFHGAVGGRWLRFLEDGSRAAEREG